MKNTENTFRKGSIFLTQFPFTDLKQSKIRPVVVISCDEAYDDVIVMAISSVTSRRDLSNTIILSPADAEFSETGLKKESCILVHRIATITKDRLFYRLGSLAQRYLDDIDKLVLGKFEIGVGKKQKQKSIPYGKQSVDTNDIFSVIKALRSDWLTTGPKVQEFEQAMADYVGAEYAVAVSSGTAALHAAMFALGIGAGDEVIVPPMTFAATANCVVFQGGTPVFADVDPYTLLLDPTKVEEKITDRTKAIIAVDYTGQPCDYDALRSLTQRHGISLVTDACHALGAEYKGEKVGTLADLSVFSFHPVKHITTGEGGMITTDDAGFAERMRLFRNHGITRDPKCFSSQTSDLRPLTSDLRPQTSDLRPLTSDLSWFYEMLDLGYNYRITDIQCALGISQLQKLPKFLQRRREIAALYDEALSAIVGIEPLGLRADVLPAKQFAMSPAPSSMLHVYPVESEGHSTGAPCSMPSKHAYHLYVVKIDFSSLGVDRTNFCEAMQRKGIGLNVHYIPVHLHPFYRKNIGTKEGHCPIAESAYGQMLSLPMYPALSDTDVERVIEAIQDLRGQMKSG